MHYRAMYQSNCNREVGTTLTLHRLRLSWSPVDVVAETTNVAKISLATAVVYSHYLLFCCRRLQWGAVTSF